MIATSTGVAPTSRAAWLTLVRPIPAFCSSTEPPYPAAPQTATAGVRLAGCAAVGIPIAAMLLQRAQVMSASPAASFPFLDNPLVNAGFVQGRLTALAVFARYLWQRLLQFLTIYRS